MNKKTLKVVDKYQSGEVFTIGEKVKIIGKTGRMRLYFVGVKEDILVFSREKINGKENLLHPAQG